MASSILVAYATKYGSTREVAEAVAKRLSEGGAEVDTKSARDVRGLDGYDAVVLGSPLYIGKLLKDATRFLESQRAGLEKVSVAVFALGPTKPDEDIAEPTAQFEKVLAEYSWLRPVATTVFYGALDPADLKFPDSLLTKLPASPLYNIPAMDSRDWDVIGAWAESLLVSLGV